MIFKTLLRHCPKRLIFMTSFETSFKTCPKNVLKMSPKERINYRLRDTLRDSPGKVKYSIHARCSDTYTTPQMYVTHTQQGDEAGDGGEEMAVDTRVQVQAEREKRAGQAGHCDAAVQDGSFRQRLFLARTRGMQQVRHAEKQHGVLAGED